MTAAIDEGRAALAEWVDDPGVRARAELTSRVHLTDDPIQPGYADLVEEANSK